MLMIGVELITAAGEAEAELERGDADLIALGRAMLYDPRWPWHAAAELGGQVKAPHQYLDCAPHSAKGLFALQA